MYVIVREWWRSWFPCWVQILKGLPPFINPSLRIKLMPTVLFRNSFTKHIWYIDLFGCLMTSNFIFSLLDSPAEPDSVSDDPAPSEPKLIPHDEVSKLWNSYETCIEVISFCIQNLIIIFEMFAYPHIQLEELHEFLPKLNRETLSDVVILNFFIFQEGTLYPKPSIQAVTSSASSQNGSQSTTDTATSTTGTKGINICSFLW